MSSLTPSFFLGNTRIDGANNIDDLPGAGAIEILQGGVRFNACSLTETTDTAYHFSGIRQSERPDPEQKPEIIAVKKPLSPIDALALLALRS